MSMMTSTLRDERTPENLLLGSDRSSFSGVNVEVQVVWECGEYQSYMNMNGMEVVLCLIPFSMKESCIHFHSKKKEKESCMRWIDEDWSWNDENWSHAVVDPLFPGNTTTMKMKLKLGNKTLKYYQHQSIMYLFWWNLVERYCW